MTKYNVTYTLDSQLEDETIEANHYQSEGPWTCFYEGSNDPKVQVKTEHIQRIEKLD